jgi:hypothetical protein
LPGELYVNWPDGQLGVVNSASNAQDLIAVRYFSTLANYALGDFAVQAGQLYRATQAISAGAFNASQWTQVGGSVSVSDSLPTNPQLGSLWWDSVGGQLYVYYNDGNTSQWVVANNTSSAATVTIGDNAPSSPQPGDMWFDSVGAQTYIWFTDANSSQWVIANNFSGGAYLPLAGGTMNGSVALKGVTDGSDAAAGQIGEYLSASLTSTSAAASNASKDIGSLALTAGDWDVYGTLRMPAIAGLQGYWGVLATAPNGANAFASTYGGAANVSSASSGLTVSGRVSTAAPLSLYLNAGVGYSGSVPTLSGFLSARRVR